MPDKILVTGATGKVGSQLVVHLLERGLDVKAGTRRPDVAEELFGSDVEIVELDYEVTSTWDGAVHWAERVFLVPSPFDPRSDESVVPFLDWAVQSGSDHIVLLSAMGIEARERLALRKIEQRIERTGVNWTFLRPNIYMQNFARGFVADAIREDGVFRLPVADARVSFVDGRDVAAAAAEVLSGPDHYGRSYTLTGPEALGHDDVAGILSDVTGRPVGYEPIEEAAMKERLAAAGWPAGQAETFAALLAAIREGRRTEVSPALEQLLGRPTTPFREFAEEHISAWQ